MGKLYLRTRPILISWLARGKKDRQKDIYLKLHKFLTLMIPNPRKSQSPPLFLNETKNPQKKIKIKTTSNVREAPGNASQIIVTRWGPGELKQM